MQLCLLYKHIHTLFIYLFYILYILYTHLWKLITKPINKLFLLFSFI